MRGFKTRGENVMACWPLVCIMKQPSNSQQLPPHTHTHTHTQTYSRCSSMLTECLQELSSDFQAVLTPPHSSTMPVLYGVIPILVFHGPVTVVNVFFPHMQSLVHYLSSLADSGGVNGKRDVSKVMDAVLVSG